MLSQAIPAFKRQAIPFILAIILVAATLSVRFEHHVDGMHASYLPGDEAHLEALTLTKPRASRRKGP